MFNQIYFVGYFQKKDEKLYYLKMFDTKERKFLESSFSYSKSSDGSVQYFPELLYKTTGKNSFLLSSKDLLLTGAVKEAYRRDYRHFLGSMRNKLKLNPIKKMVLILSFVMYRYRKEYPKASLFNIFKWKQVYKTLRDEYNQKDETLLFNLKKHIFRLQFIKGYRYVFSILEKLKNESLFVLWGKSYSGRVILVDYLKQKNIPYMVSEYGEISGTISCSKHGIFGETMSIKQWDTLYEKPLDKNDITYANDILREIKSNQISTRSYDNNMFFFMKYFYDNSVKIDEKQRRKIIYVNGSELFSSGLYHNRWGIVTHGKNPNQYLLEKVVEYFDTDKYMILYKEHPMALSHNKKALLNPSDFPTVGFLGNMNIHDVLDISDIVITYPSKVVITSLLYEKSTFVLGDFTIPKSIPEMKYFTSRSFNDISLMSKDYKYNPELFVEFVARLIKYNLIAYNDSLFYKFDENIEKEKLSKFLSINGG